MASPVPLPFIEASTFVDKKTLSFRYTIKDATMSLKFSELRSPPFSVLLSESTSPQGSWNSVWHILIYSGLVQEECVSFTVSLCQGWNRGGQIVEYEQDRKLAAGEVLISNCRFTVLNPETQQTVYNGSDCECVCTISNEEPMKIVSCSFSNEEYEERHDLDFTIERIPNAGYKILYDDTLTVQVEADLFFINEPVKDIIPPDSIREDIQNFYKTEELTDTIIKCDEKEFKVHKFIFALQSPVFRAMFDVDMKEKRSGVVEVSGITSAAMSDLVTYIYTGTAPNLKTLANELLDVAEKYQLYRLFNLCEHELQNKITEICVVDTLIQADLYSRACLKKACLELIRRNSMKMFAISEWEALKEQHTSLYLEALEFCAGKFSK